MGGPGAALLLLACIACGCDDDPPAADAVADPSSGPPAGLTEAAWGERLFQQYGCTGCHQINGHPSVGPPLDGLLGTERRLEDGSRVRADAAYVRRSILTPEAERVAGYDDARMTPYEGLLEPDQLAALVAYLESLR